jgi:predicted nicotinamide N-methyase
VPIGKEGFARRLSSGCKRTLDKPKPTRAGPDVAAFIETHLPLVPVNSIPEIRLHRAQASSGLWRLAQSAKAGFGAPYWAYPWAGGIALARYVLDQPEVVADRSVFDLGAGSGLVGIAAAKAGARHVLAADTDGHAIIALGLNAAANNVSLSTICSDVTAAPPPAADVVLVGDLFYEAVLAQRVTAFLETCVSAGLSVLIGDPGRAFLPLPRLRRLAEYPVTDFGDAGTAVRTSMVFAFEARRP